MKILYLHQYFNTPNMPGGTRSYEMAKMLSRWGHEVHLITTDRADEKRGEWWTSEEEGFCVHWTPVPYSNRMDYRARLGAFAKFAARACSKAVDIGGDIVFASSTPLTVAIPGVRASKRLGVPFVFEVRDLWPEIPIAIGAIKNPILIRAARWLEKYAYRNSSRIVALSPGIKKSIAVSGFPEEKVAVIPNSCDLGLFQVPPEDGGKIRRSFDWLGDRPLVVYLGTFGRINGVSYLARVAAEVRKSAPEIRFAAIGEGKEWEEVETLAKELGILNENFFLFKEIPKKETPSWFSAATITTSLFIDLPEMWSNSANKFFDSLAAGRPVAINYNGWQAEILQDTGAGIVLDPENTEAASAAIIESIHDLDWIIRASHAAKKLAVERFDRVILARALEAVLIDACTGKVADRRG
ncbi:MAG: glycosyltransferase family 4 protein [Syntrophorhabdus aromaticivorans]|uniref:Glycosyltransferase family 4 protein n=1 Tax=Syntrophorhabdus aromaticivorans TaxID=328301 RepID=A0A971M5P2_9BACT|nr:glycosyltransferase family 4 protein [Syntrophorhabdus aromaticivorans]